MTPQLVSFLGGAATFGFLVSGLFFLDLWRRSRDGLFLAFATAFVLLGIGQALVTLSGIPAEERSPLYLVRLTAFSLIIIAIARKNAKA